MTFSVLKPATAPISGHAHSKEELSVLCTVMLVPEDCLELLFEFRLRLPELDLLLAASDAGVLPVCAGVSSVAGVLDSLMT